LCSISVEEKRVIKRVTEGGRKKMGKETQRQRREQASVLEGEQKSAEIQGRDSN
jgi:hypothetical protein